MPERIKLIISIVQQVVYIVLYILCIYQLVMFFVHDNLYDKLISLMMSGLLLLYLSIREVCDRVKTIENTLDRLPKITVLSNNFDAPKNNSTS